DGACSPHACSSPRDRCARPPPHALDAGTMTFLKPLKEMGILMIRLLLVALLTGFSLVTPARAETPEREKLTVMLEWFVNPDHAPLVVADKLGFFAQQGLDVELLPPADPSMVPRAVAAGQVDIGIHYQPNLYLDHAAG